MKFKTFIIGFLILTLTPILVIGGFAAYTYLSNASPQSGLIQYSVEPQIVFTGEPVNYNIHFSGDKAPRPEGKPMPPLDMIFVIDVSGSMHSSLPDMKNAARTVARELVNAYPSGHIRFSLTQFHDSSEIKSAWTPDPNVLYTGLNNLDLMSGNNGTDLAFPPIHQLFNQGRSNATKAVVFYTDGHIGVDDSIIKKAEILRKQGVQIFSISPPGYDSEAMFHITGEWERVLEPLDLKDQVKKFRKVADIIIGLYGYNAGLTHHLDTENFFTPIEGTEWSKNDAGYLQRDIGYLSFKSLDFNQTLIPQTIGQWTVGLAAPEIAFINSQNQPDTMRGTRQPQLLVLSIWLLVLAFLPALLWLLAYLMRHRPTAIVPEYSPPPIRSLPLPTPLPLPYAAVLERKTLVPTLFIGIGGAGRQELVAIQEALRAGHLELNNPPCRFLGLDLDNSTQNDNDKVPELIAPQAIRQTAQYLPAVSEPLPNHLKWFNPQDYIDTARADLDLSKGSKGQRLLARLALFQWLEKGELLTALTEEYDKLLEFASIDDQRQIILIADHSGGVGSGWMLDIARILRRLASQNRDGQKLVPEMISILLSPSNLSTIQQENRQALDHEIESAQLAGGFPQPVTYKPDDALLDQIDHESPFNWLFSVNSASALSAVLVERYPRWTLLNDPFNKGQIVSAKAKAIHVMPDLNYQLVKRDILLRLLGVEVLLDLERDEASQKLILKSFSEEEAEKLIIKWQASEAKGTPWQLLLNLVVGLETQFFEIMEEKGHPDLIWFQQAFVASIARQLRGEKQDGRWVRTWMPSGAVAALRLFAERLEQRVQPQAPVGELLAIILKLIELSRETADSLELWVKEFIPFCEQIGKEQQQLIQQHQATSNLEDQIFIDKSLNVEKSATEAMQQWVGSVDISSSLCERIFLIARLDKNAVAIVFAAYIEEKQEFSTAKAAAQCLQGYAECAAKTVSTLKVEGALAAQDVQALAKYLVESQPVAEQVVMVTPSVVDAAVSKTLKEFKQALPSPAGHAPAKYCEGNDHSAIRRLALRTEVLPAGDNDNQRLPFAQVAEQTAELIRQRAMTKFQINIPVFPATLRIALSQPDAFQSFSHAYKAGHIIKDENSTDERGISQWVFGGHQFITFGQANSLADAAANYVYMIKNPPMDFSDREPVGDFSELDAWQSLGGVPQNEDVFVLIAIEAI